MEYDEVVVKESPGLCRCCLSEGCYKDLGTEYTWMSETEVYAEMLLECFDIGITQHNDGPNGPNRLICEVCITRLRDACNFKKQVLESEKKFIDMIGRGEFRPKVLIYQTQMKSEDITEEEDQVEETEVEYLEDDIDFVDADDEPLKSLANATISEVTDTRTPLRNKRGRPRKNPSSVKTEKKVKVDKEEKPKTSKAMTKDSTMEISPNPEESSNAVTVQVDVHHRHCSQLCASVATTNHVCVNETQATSDVSSIHPGYPKTAAERMREYRARKKKETLMVNHQKQKRSAAERAKEYRIRKKMKIHSGDNSPTDTKASDKRSHMLRGELRKFVSIVLETSTIMPFKWYLNRFMCFYCECTFLESSMLKIHTKDKHQDFKLKDILKGIGAHSRIKWDLSQISCKKCSKHLSSLEDFLDHAASAHRILLNKDIVKYCYGFNLSDDTMSCVECGDRFTFFTPLLRHVNKYHNTTKHFICDICGEVFSLKGTLKTHITNVHSAAPSVCKICKTAFQTRYALKKHNESVHRKRAFGCSMCPEVFGSRYLKKCHLVLVHDLKSCQFCCEDCPKVFTEKSKLLRHRSMVHLREKRFTCHVCGYKSIDMAALKNHLVLHDDTRPFQCDICNKTFRRKKTLTVHKITHRSC